MARTKYEVMFNYVENKRRSVRVCVAFKIRNDELKETVWVSPMGLYAGLGPFRMIGEGASRPFWVNDD
jgi:hypothetical protein